jgi:hypothetical protein
MPKIRIVSTQSIRSIIVLPTLIAILRSDIVRQFDTVKLNTIEGKSANSLSTCVESKVFYLFRHQTIVRGEGESEPVHGRLVSRALLADM